MCLQNQNCSEAQVVLLRHVEEVVLLLKRLVLTDHSALGFPLAAGSRQLVPHVHPNGAVLVELDVRHEHGDGLAQRVCDAVHPAHAVIGRRCGEIRLADCTLEVLGWQEISRYRPVSRSPILGTWAMRCEPVQETVPLPIQLIWQQFGALVCVFQPTSKNVISWQCAR